MKLKLSKSFLFALLSATVWLLCVVLDSKSGVHFYLDEKIESFLHSFLLAGFTFFTFLFYRSEITSSKQVSDLLDLLWRSFVTSMVAFVLVFVLRIVVIGNKLTTLFSMETLNFWGYYVYVAAIVIFQANIFYIYKNLSFYPKVRSLERQWQIVEVLLIVLLVYSTIFPGAGKVARIICFGGSILVSLSFAVRLKWVVYLDFKQKVQAVLLITSVMLMGLFFLQLFWGEEMMSKSPYTVSDNLFYYSQFTFFGVYSLFSVLMLLFNIPASSVFDKKLEEMGRFQKFSEALQQEGDEKNVISQLLDGGIAISVADAAWVEYYVKDEKREVYTRNLDSATLLALRKKLAKPQEGLKKTETIIRELPPITVEKGSSAGLSMLSFPLVTSNTSYGFVVLLKYVRDGFEKDIIGVLRTYTQQAALSLENMTLLSEAIEKERYLEEIKISKRIQKSLLPKYNLSYDDLKISHFTKSTGTVGGDFFDFCTSNGTHYWVAIGDVAGKGTSAAFLMAQLKGIFRSLVQVCSGPRNLVVRANHALAYSTEKTAFITLSVFLVDTEKRVLRHVRAGHCQAIFYSKQTNQLTLLEPKGMGLGILKDDSFKNYIEEEGIQYSEGDSLYLYTDGVTEARNEKSEMFGIEKLMNFISNNNQFEVEEIVVKLGQYLADFCGKSEEDDDVTFLLVRFY